ncbi:MAG: MBL fold metallo-hydrolase [Luminiphilus sp.]|nr:MBL fold metallo-hydrolase [Luminiphilus sp.]
MSQPTQAEKEDWILSEHWDGKRFHNRNGSDKHLGDISRYLWSSITNEAPWPKWVENPAADPIIDRVTSGIRATYINHATVLIQVAGLNILTDPVWSKRVSPVTFAGPQRVRAPGIPLSALPDIDLILISHNHYDHLDSQSLRSILKQQDTEPLIVTGLGNAKLLRKLGYEGAVELDWGESQTLADSTVHFVECQHRSGRGVLDQMKTLWGSFVVETPEGALYFAGDTGYSPHFQAQGERWGPFALSVLPIGAYEPRWFMKDIHLNPEEAVRAHQDLRSQQSLAIHFGVFQLTWEAIDDPQRDLATALADQGLPEASFWVLDPGAAATLGD